MTAPVENVAMNNTKGRRLHLAIHPDNTPLSSGRHQSFSERWIELAKQDGHRVRMVDAYADSIFEQLHDCDGFMWYFWNALHSSEPGKRVISALHHVGGIATFPDWRTMWFFEDKIAQRYLLAAAGIPIAKTVVLWNIDAARAYAETADYPLVLKLGFGITSNNVRMVRTAAEAQRWINRLFGDGMVVLPERVPVRLLQRLWQRSEDTVRVARGWRLKDHSGYGPVQRECVLFQEYLPDNSFDTRVTVIGTRAFAFRRFNRPSDFRASGSGLIDWDPQNIDPDAIQLAFKAAERLRGQVVALDILHRADELVVVEVSHYYEAWAVQACPGHFERTGDTGMQPRWVSGQMLPHDAIYQDFVSRILR